MEVHRFKAFWNKVFWNGLESGRDMATEKLEEQVTD